MFGFRQRRRHLDEYYVKLGGDLLYLWRAVDHDGEILKGYITKKRDTDAARRFMNSAAPDLAHVHRGGGARGGRCGISRILRAR
jgi:hypothetical protein